MKKLLLAFLPLLMAAFTSGDVHAQHTDTYTSTAADAHAGKRNISFKMTGRGGAACNVTSTGILERWHDNGNGTGTWDPVYVGEPIGIGTNEVTFKLDVPAQAGQKFRVSITTSSKPVSYNSSFK